MVNFFLIFEIKLFCFVLAMSEVVHDADAIQGLMYTANSIWKSFLKYE